MHVLQEGMVARVRYLLSAPDPVRQGGTQTLLHPLGPLQMTVLSARRADTVAVAEHQAFALEHVKLDGTAFVAMSMISVPGSVQLDGTP
ncbi:hypothetical protein N9K47_00140 [bacterium]|nr:hypothetical protein [bacterium]